jgi:phage terminase Nu1 subunit (DNA packaging protein)
MFLPTQQSEQGGKSLSRGELAKAMGVSVRCVSLWLKRGCPRGLRGRFDLGTVKRWRREHIRELTPGLAYWRCQLEKQKAFVEEHKLRELESSLISAEVVRQRAERQITHAKTVLGRLPERLLGALPKEWKPGQKKAFKTAAAQMVADALGVLTGDGSPA